MSAVVQTHADTGRSKGWALVKFVTAEQAAYAVRIFNQQEFNERTLNVHLDRAHFDEVAGIKIFVGNLPFSCTEADVVALFAPFRQAEVLLKTTRSGKSRGFALVNFPEATDAQAAMAALHGLVVDGRKLEVREDRPGEAAIPVAQGKGGGGRAAGKVGRGAEAGPISPSTKGEVVPEPDPSNTLYVSNLNWNSTDDDLFQHFCSSAGVVPTSAKVQMSDTNGRSKGWGLVVFASVDEADRARVQLNKSVLDERKISVRFNGKALS